MYIYVHNQTDGKFYVAIKHEKIPNRYSLEHRIPGVADESMAEELIKALNLKAEQATVPDPPQRKEFHVQIEIEGEEHTFPHELDTDSPKTTVLMESPSPGNYQDKTSSCIIDKWGMRLSTRVKFPRPGTYLVIFER